jgi:hypothetical protein
MADPLDFQSDGAQHHRRDGPVDLWTALPRRVPAFALRAILWTARGQPWRVAHRPTTGRRLPTTPPARKPASFKKNKKTTKPNAPSPARRNLRGLENT